MLQKFDIFIRRSPGVPIYNFANISDVDPSVINSMAHEMKTMMLINSEILRVKTSKQGAERHWLVQRGVCVCGWWCLKKPIM